MTKGNIPKREKRAHSSKYCIQPLLIGSHAFAPSSTFHEALFKRKRTTGRVVLLSAVMDTSPLGGHCQGVSFQKGA